MAVSVQGQMSSVIIFFSSFYNSFKIMLYYSCNKAVYKGKDIVVLIILKLMWTLKKYVLSDFTEIIPLQLLTGYSDQEKQKSCIWAIMNDRSRNNNNFNSFPSGCQLPYKSTPIFPFLKISWHPYCPDKKTYTTADRKAFSH